MQTTAAIRRGHRYRSCHGQLSEGEALPPAGASETCRRAEGNMSDEILYHSFLNRDRLIHIVDTDPTTCEALSVLFRL